MNTAKGRYRKYEYDREEDETGGRNARPADH